MSHTHPTSPGFRQIFDNALEAYERYTGIDLPAHPLSAQLRECNSPANILSVLQALASQLSQSQRSNGWLVTRLDPVVRVLHAFSPTVREAFDLAFSPVTMIFTGVGVLLSAAKNVGMGQDTLIEVFERIEVFLRRLELYVETAVNQEMVDIIIKILVEVINLLGITTKEIRQGRAKKYLKKLMGRTHIKDALKRLDWLTQEEARVAAAQVLKVTNTVDERARRLIQDVSVVEDRVTRIVVDLHDNTMAAVRSERNRLRRDLREWLSPPDPSTNHNIACNAHHEGTATWFFQSGIYNKWISTGTESLLWIHGKPGSGKSILCSTIIQDVKIKCDAGLASMAYFYFDFRDINKQHCRDLVTSLLTQLSSHSDLCGDILLHLYSAHDGGAQKPSDDTLTRCLKEMLTLPGQCPIYLIMDALDECSNISGVPSPRDRVLELVKEFVDLCLPSLHICVTSRPEVDIRDVLEPLTHSQVSLHDQSEQKKDILDYIRSVVNSDQVMRRWKEEDKTFVIETLSECADGMFRWAFCQLETLRQCFPSRVRRILEELPESLDETYERLLKEIRKPDREDVRRLLHCLVMAARPLRVMELAEVLAVDFNDAEGIPRLNPHWRWEDQERALLLACSSLITIVEVGDSRIVRFSHFSIKDFLTSPRLATTSHDLSAYYVNLEHAHTILGQACLGVLLRIHDGVDGHTSEVSSLARYAAEHWTTHAQYEDVSSRLQRGMEYFFDPDKPHFAYWLTLNNIDTEPPIPSTFHLFTQIDKTPARPLYYAALCGFHDLVEHLITKYPQDVNASGGYYVRPLVAALAKEHFQTADLLRLNGADPHVRIGDDMISPLHVAAYSENLKMVEKLIEYGADINAEDSLGRTPLYFASEHDNLEDCSAMRLLLKRGADVNARAKDASTTLHVTSRCGALEVVCLMLEYGADPNVQDEDESTPLHLASRCGHVDIARILLEHGADPNAPDVEGWASLHQASGGGYVEVVRLLLEHGANVNAQDPYKSTLPHLASGYSHVDIPKALPEFDVEADSSSWSSLHLASQEGHLEVVRLLLNHGADPNVYNEDWHTPLFLASSNGRLEVVRSLLQFGAYLDDGDLLKKTSLHGASENGHFEVILLLLDNGAVVNAKDAHFWTPLHMASKTGNLKVALELLYRGADVEAQDDLGWTSLHLASQEGHQETVELLLKYDAQVNAPELDDETALHLAAYYGRLQTTKLLLEHGANARARNKDGKMPFELATKERHQKVAQLVSEFETRGQETTILRLDDKQPIPLPS